ncbi:hypothetical protein ILYODFUR_031115 [Ilyodon furcidens]|uniref:Uncharacterized protein n=1 Tax=Ilyodon furcidens TaxID=33524 RepID=A0ABV0TZ80_9TELE
MDVTSNRHSVIFCSDQPDQPVLQIKCHTSFLHRLSCCHSAETGIKLPNTKQQGEKNDCYYHKRKLLQFMHSASWRN